LGLYFDFARQFFDYSALFIVHGEIAEGRDAFGTGAARERVVALGVPLDLPVPSLMSTARDTLRPAVARAPTDSLDAELRADLQLGAGGEMAVIPLVVRSRSVALVLGDCGDGGVDNEALDQIGACGTTIGRAFERLIIRKKKDGITPRFAEETPSSDAAAPMTQRSSALQVSSPQTGSDSAVVGSFFPAVQPSPFLSSPPPANIAVVRPLTGPPLPREEPEPLSAPGGAETSALETSTSSGIESLSSTSAALFHMQVARPEHADTPDASVALEHNIPSELDSGTLFDMLGWEGPGSDSDSPPPSEAHAVPPHRPPSARSGPPEEGLPSVIVDLDHELNVIVDRLIAGSTESERGEAEGELLRQGERAMRVIMARFPGPVNLDRKAIVAMAAPPKPSECGTLMRLVARERKVALPFVLERLSDPDPETVQAAALHAIVAIGRIAPIDTRAVIREHARGLDAVERAAAMHVIGELRDQVLVPELVRALVDTHSDVVVSAHDALVQVSCQDFGADARPWVRWWDHHSTQHRIEWLIDALTHDVVEIRRAAAVELRGVTREYFGYSADLPLRDRERAQQRYRDWWATDGRTRFRNRREA
jgi:hypothetical protein